MKPNERLKALADAPLGRLVMRFSWPALVSMTLNALYSIVDRIYIGQGCGQGAMAGLTLAFPVMMVFGAFGVFVGAGHAAVLSIKLGEGDRTACEKVLGELVALKLLFFFTLPPLVFAFIDPILRWSGGSAVTAEALEMGKTYLRLVVFSHLFSHLAFGLSASMRSEGAVVPSMMCMVVGFGVNLVLDPIFIFGFGMGVAGAAWATNIAMACSCAWALWYYRPGHSAVRLRWRRIGFYRNYLAKACGIGLSPALQQLAGSLVNVSLQLAFAYWAADEASATAQVASLGIFQMVTMFFIMPLLGTVDVHGGCVACGGRRGVRGRADRAAVRGRLGCGVHPSGGGRPARLQLHALVHRPERGGVDVLPVCRPAARGDPPLAPAPVHLPHPLHVGAAVPRPRVGALRALDGDLALHADLGRAGVPRDRPAVPRTRALPRPRGARQERGLDGRCYLGGFVVKCPP